MRLYKMELFKLFQNKIFKIGMLAATGLLFLYFWFAEVGGEIATVAHVEETDTMRQVLEKMEHHGYTAIPLLSVEGKYIGTITEGDLLWFLKDRNFPDLKLLEDMPITSIERRRDNQAVKIDESMENLFDKVMNQNFVPVVDDKRVFIGIVTRKDVLAYLGKKAAPQA